MNETAADAAALSKVAARGVRTRADMLAHCNRLRQEYDNLEKVKEKYINDRMAKEREQEAATSKKAKGNLSAQKSRISKGKLENAAVRQAAILWELNFWKERANYGDTAELLEDSENHNPDEYRHQHARNTAEPRSRSSTFNMAMITSIICSLWRDEQRQEEHKVFLENLCCRNENMQSPVERKLKYGVMFLIGKIHQLLEELAGIKVALERAVDSLTQAPLKHRLVVTYGLLKFLRLHLRCAIGEAKADCFQEENAALKDEVRSQKQRIDQLESALRQRDEEQQQRQQQLQDEIDFPGYNPANEEDVMDDLNNRFPSPLLGESETDDEEDPGVSNNPPVWDANLEGMSLSPSHY